jgi:hypothetical protein
MTHSGGNVPAPSSGYLQFIRHETLIGLAAEKGAVIRLLHRPGHFLVRGHPMATVWPPDAARGVSEALRRAHLMGSSRTLAQDMSFAIDQLVEIAIRALSAAVNDTFTAMTCIDWLGASLCEITTRWRPVRVHRDSHGYVRLITAHVSYTRLVERAFEKIRQAGRGMPAVLIRQLEALTKIIDHTTSEEQRELLLAQAAMILQASEESVPEPADRADVHRQHHELLAACNRAAQLRTGAGPVAGVSDAPWRPSWTAPSIAAESESHQPVAGSTAARATSARARSAPRPSQPRPISDSDQSSRATPATRGSRRRHGSRPDQWLARSCRRPLLRPARDSGPRAARARPS